jgi:multidrug efflux pump subunit AcrB
LTSIVGTLPLVLVPGPGSAIYRGLGIVMVGGMSLNTAFLLLLLPALLRLREQPAGSVAPAPAALPDGLAVTAR